MDINEARKILNKFNQGNRIQKARVKAQELHDAILLVATEGNLDTDCYELREVFKDDAISILASAELLEDLILKLSEEGSVQRHWALQWAFIRDAAKHLSTETLEKIALHVSKWEENYYYDDSALPTIMRPDVIKRISAETIKNVLLNICLPSSTNRNFDLSKIIGKDVLEKLSAGGQLPSLILELAEIEGENASHAFTPLFEKGAIAYLHATGDLSTVLQALQDSSHTFKLDLILERSFRNVLSKGLEPMGLGFVVDCGMVTGPTSSMKGYYLNPDGQGNGCLIAVVVDSEVFFGDDVLGKVRTRFGIKDPHLDASTSVDGSSSNVQLSGAQLVNRPMISAQVDKLEARSLQPAIA